jgi:hypothetical protein
MVVPHVSPGAHGPQRGPIRREDLVGHASLRNYLLGSGLIVHRLRSHGAVYVGLGRDT